jgi:GNAT superfamily N-acetyltransferase
MTTTSRRGRHPYRGNRPSVYSGGVPNGLIRRAQPNDVPEILAMVRDLAEYEKAVHEAIATEAQFHEALFGPQPTVFAHVVEHESGELHLGGFALWFLNFSTWLGRNGIYLEDLYVRPELRGTGYGKRLLATLARECLDNGFGRLDWWVLDWNQSSRDFYAAHGADALTEWIPYRVTGPALADLAALTDAAGGSDDLDLA